MIVLSGTEAVASVPLSTVIPRAGNAHLQQNLVSDSYIPFQYLVPSKDTTYLCTGFQLDYLSGKHHIVEVRDFQSNLCVIFASFNTNAQLVLILGGLNSGIL